MATNYTTKTAALKATKADMRQVPVSKKIEIGSTDTKTIIEDGSVSADDVLIGVEVEKDGVKTRERQSVLDLIQNAGLNVGADADGDYTPEAPVKTNKINFIGAYVNVVDNGKDGMNIYIGENNNNPSFSSLSDSFANSRLVYSSGSSEYSLPSDATAGSDYGRVSALTENETVNVQGGALIGNILKDAKVKVTVTSDKGTIVYEAPETISSVAGETGVSKTARLNDGTTYADAATSKTWEDTTKGIKIVGSSMIKYTSADAKNGFTPDSSTGKFVITIDNDKVVGANGGWYQVNVKIGGTDKTTSKVFVYKAYALTSSDKPTVTTTYTPNTTNRWLSGIEYQSGGKVKVEVTNIQNTQKQIHTKTKLNNVTNDWRLTVSDNDGKVAFTQYVPKSSLTLTSGTAGADNAVYSWSEEKDATTSSPAKVACTVTVTSHGQAGTAESAATGTGTNATQTMFLYTTTTADTTNADTVTTNFHTETKRMYGNLASAKAGTLTAYDSKKSLATDYTDQLLVQGGSLKYPTQANDTTKTYNITSGTRYFVRSVEFNKAIGTLNVKVGGWSTSYNNDKVLIYLVDSASGNAQALNWYSKASSKPTGATAISNNLNPSGGQWNCAVSTDDFAISAGKTYYLVVEMKQATTIGAISLW